MLVKDVARCSHELAGKVLDAAIPTTEADSPIAIERFMRAMWKRLNTGTIQFRKACVCSPSVASRSMTARSGSSVPSKRWSRPSSRAGNAAPVFPALYRSGVPGR
jgi:hypothetical protein